MSVNVFLSHEKSQLQEMLSLGVPIEDFNFQKGERLAPFQLQAHRGESVGNNKANKRVPIFNKPPHNY